MDAFMKKRGVFGGSFDPIHFGHLSLLLDVWEKGWLDEVILMPAFCSPHKQGSPPKASPEDRFKMAQIAIADFPFPWTVSRWEIDKPRVSYAVDTLEELGKDPQVSLYFLLSAANMAAFPQWKNPKRILELATPIVGLRKDHPQPQLFSSSLEKSFADHMFRVRTMEISSTDVRMRRKKGLAIEHLVPSKVVDYIRKKNLYL
ncbi:MAG: nicotinate-nucleotide adenylyltransferase [Chlamydiota bacterium]